METTILTRRSATAALLLTAVILVISVQASPAAAGGSRHTDYSYSWPVKPFDQPHPVRGGFGDPRTVFAGPPTQRTLNTGGGSFQFHDGIDISASDGTAVYPVESGTVAVVVQTAHEQYVAVACADGRSFEYWHIAASVSVGAHVDAHVSVLGHILRAAGHVHLTELDRGVSVNPLAPGRLGPYADTTAPVVSSIAFRKTVTGRNLMPELLRGRVEILADAHDMPALTVHGVWHDLPVTPALLEWRIQKADTGKVVVPTHVVYDVRDRLPALGDFWRVYARGTHQNMSVFGRHYSFMQPGVYLFRLAPGGFDTRRLPDCVYDLVVTATDIRGNRISTVQRFSVHNKPGVVGT